MATTKSKTPHSGTKSLGDGPHRYHFVPTTIQIHSGANAKIYVNTIINSPKWSTSTSADPSPKTSHSGTKSDAGEENPGCKSETFSFPSGKGGRLEIYSGEEGSHNPPVITVVIEKLSPGGTSEIKPVKAYVTTVDTNNVSGKGAPTAPVSAKTVLHEIIKGDNVILNSPGDINVGPGAGASNEGPFSGSSNSWPKER